MQELALNWYALLSAVYGAVAEPLSSAATQINIPLLSALLLGILGATSPCQFTTGLPPAFALGTTLPRLALVAALAARPGSPLAYVGRVRRLDRWLRPMAGVVLLAAGLNDTLVYWFL